MKYTFYILLALLASVMTYNVLEHTEKKDQKPKKALAIDLETYWNEKVQKRKDGYAKLDAPEMHSQIRKESMTPIGADAPQYNENYKVREYRKAKKKAEQSGIRSELDFISRGPGNIAGRTRAILVDPRDETNSTWIAGSASGGIWKTSNAGQSWRNVSQDLPTLSTNTLANSPANPDIIYAGTGEHFVDDTDGNGMFKSTDGGESWFQIADPETYPGFKNVSRIIVDPNNSNIVLATTSNGSWVETEDYAIFKSEDGGENWRRVYTSQIGRLDDLDFNPDNFSVMYAAVQSYGVIKSFDSGETWEAYRSGMSPGGRVEICISPVDTNIIWASAQGSLSGTGSDLYVSFDGAQNWKLIQDEDQNINFLGGQGWYDNIIAAHPYNKDIAYIGGVNTFKYTHTGTDLGEQISFNSEYIGTQEFVDFVQASGFDGDGFDFGSIDQSELKSVEIRFGQGTQKAHRFTVSMQGSGVPANEYLYRDFVEVPFQVWDKDNDKQLMVSFRDQQEDGQWNLIERETGSGGPEDSREYLFIHDVEYREVPNADIANNGGHEFREMYLFWPFLVEGAEFDPQNLPLSTIEINRIAIQQISGTSEVISDAYFQFGGLNSFSNNNFINQEGLHPDQHNIIILPIDEENETFRFVITNDGGVYQTIISDDPGVREGDFIHSGKGFNTSQFYGADKAPGEDRYIGGMQDNSTWYTAPGESADSTSEYIFAFGGDGFESVWNNRDPNLMIGSVQFNAFRRSLDGGLSWENATFGYEDGSPFISRLANHKNLPDKLYTVGTSGVWISEDFGGTWRLNPIAEQWGFNNSIDIEVSKADYNTIYTGGFLSDVSRIFVSKDGGISFEPSANYELQEMGFVSGIGTHPGDPATAFALFSFAGKPKVLKTIDYGQTWIDISGFEGNNGISDRGFPDVAIQSLLVFPNDTDRIWVGSEIGIIESLDGGESWNLLQSNMPPAYVHEFKIQDDQVVMATYGRGIWSVTIPEVEQEIIFPPYVNEANLSPTGDLNINIFYAEVFDSSNIIVDENIEMKLGMNEVGELLEVLSGLSLEGEVLLEIESFINGESYLSPPYLLELLDIREAVTSYFNDFEDPERIEEFGGSGFSVRLESGFSNEAIHSDHPYPDLTESTYTLKIPYVLTEESPNELQYEDVAIIEPGEPGTEWPDDEFWDYVIVEGTRDGIEWIELTDGYDARLFPEWQLFYNNGDDGVEDIYNTQKIFLNDFFDIGDTILVRFRLFADPFVTGWGWVIDNVEIGEVSSSSDDLTIDNNIYVFPNPVKNVLNIKLDKPYDNLNIQLFSIDGQLIKTGKFPNTSIINLETENLNQGQYFVRIAGDGVDIIQKIIKL